MLVYVHRFRGTKSLAELMNVLRSRVVRITRTLRQNVLNETGFVIRVAEESSIQLTTFPNPNHVHSASTAVSLVPRNEHSWCELT